MGRLDDAAKRKVVELREAGLSFRKIKAVLELENIKVSAQAIYLFLKEFQGRAHKEDGAAGNSSHIVPVSMPGGSETRTGSWSDQQLRNLLREASRVAASQLAGSSANPRVGQPSGTGPAGSQGADKDEDIRIVSVTSLAQGTQHAGVQGQRSGVGTGAMGAAAAAAAAFIRKRHTPSPANPMLVARKRLLDKALLHRARVRDSGPQSGQPVSVSVRRDQSCFSTSDGRKLVLPQSASYDLTTARPPNMRALHQGASPHRRWMHQRVGVPVRVPQNPPRVGIRLPEPSTSAATSQNTAAPARVQNMSNQPSPPPPPAQRNVLEAGAVSSLQEQIQLLGNELRSLGLALRMMVDHQGRLEREQAQQTQVQKQILSTLQDLATKFDPLQPTSAPASCSMASSTVFSQAPTNQSVYAQCSQAQTRYNEIHDSGLEGIEVFSLDQLSPTAMNGFQSCPTSSGPPFTHAQVRTPTFTQTQTFASSTLPFTQTHTDSFIGMDGKTVDLASTSADGSFQACSPANQTSSLPVSPHDSELNIIKVENV
ncbi:uncharacterized protein LOC130220851 [Danio aesculapii]|uniref:uncharacterized protein LOC130220851 n=1 Tax=Danio aesculapii TaxID=1142201 RepID=UPI0024C008CD|nr:uncharacterized protein LOC130220851 [Danio aesculapii]